MSERRVLVLNSHEAWVAQLSILPIPIDIVVGLTGRSTKSWDERMRPVPSNARLVSLAEALANNGSYSVAVAHSVTDLLELKNLEIPKVFVIHTTLEGRLTEQGCELETKRISEETKKYLKLIKAHTIAVSSLKQRSWNIPADLLGFSVNVEDYPRANCEIPQGLRISNYFNRRRKILLADLHDQAFGDLPLEMVGVNDDIEGGTPAADWDDLKMRIARSRFYVHTADPRLEDGYNMATVEAMASGLPVLGNRHPTSPIEHGVEGFLSDDATELARYARRLLEDRDLALEMGEAARRKAADVWAPEKFREGFLRALSKAKTKFFEHAQKKTDKKRTAKRKRR